MGLQNAICGHRCGCISKFGVAIATILMCAVFCSAQTASKPPGTPWANDLQKYPGLSQEFGKLFNKMQTQIQPPPLRSQSKLLTLLPDSTLYYAAFPNYGDEVRQALAIFQQERRESPVLREWWANGEMTKSGPAFEMAIEKISDFSQYLGNEIVVAGDPETPGHAFVVISEVKKPGLADFIQQAWSSIPGAQKPPFRLLDLQHLASATDNSAPSQLVVLIRPDFVIAASSVKAVRSFNDLIESKAGGFATTAFGQRIGQAYANGVSSVGGADIEKLLKQLPAGAAANQEMLAHSGFGDMKYVVWEHKSVTGQPASQTELSFTGPRRGVASWLAAPAAMNSLNFVSPKAVLATTLILKNWSEIFDDIQALSTSTNPNAMASLNQMQQAMNLNLKNDLLRYFDGEVTLELDSVTPPNPAWKAILRVNHPEKLQQTLDKLLATVPFPARQYQENGIDFHSLRIPSANKTTEIVYAFVDGYLLIASGQDAAAEAVSFHKSGGSLMTSPRFVAALPPGRAGIASALFYEDPATIATIGLKDAPPEIAATLLQLKQAAPPIVVAGYGEDAAIRIASGNGGADMGAILIGAAIAIPNLLRARMAANEASAVASLRTLNTAQIVYSSTYPQKGYARDLASLGPDPRGAQFLSARHAGVVDVSLGGPLCTAGSWCSKSGYKFMIKTACGQTACRDFVVTATPEKSNSGTKNFCSTADAVVRYQAGVPLNDALSVAQCKAWEPLR